MPKETDTPFALGPNEMAQIRLGVSRLGSDVIEGLEHVFGPAKADFSVADGIQRLASAMGAIADALTRIADQVTMSKVHISVEREE